mgnify:CR=1 FL=1
MVIHGHSRFIHGHSWSFMDIHGHSWSFMDIHGHSRFKQNNHDIIQVRVEARQAKIQAKKLSKMKNLMRKLFAVPKFFRTFATSFSGRHTSTVPTNR